MRIGIVNDLSLAVETLKRVILTMPEYEVAWIAWDGVEALEKCARDKPDLILMDLIMPNMDGVEATRQIMETTPCAILVVTATVTGNSSMVFDAMGYGALDAVCTPVFGSGGTLEGAKDLLNKIYTIGKLIDYKGMLSKAPDRINVYTPGNIPQVVAIGASTGGPKALAKVLKDLPANEGLCVIIIQHVDSQFAEGLADWLDRQTSMEVKIIKEGMHPETNTVMLAKTNDHLILDKDYTFYYTAEPISYPFRPSVNVFFNSLARNWQRPDIAVLLTGMGDDGANGMNALRKAGWHTIAQDEESSVVYGMPKAAAELNAAIKILPVDEIHEEIKDYYKF